MLTCRSRHRSYRFAGMMAAILSVATSAASCNSDPLAPRAEVALSPRLKEQPRVGLDGLRQELYAVRLMATDPVSLSNVRVATTFSEALSLDRYVSYLESLLQHATKGERPASFSEEGTYSPQVGGTSYIYTVPAGYSPPAFREVRFGATTSCWQYPSTTEAYFKSDNAARYGSNPPFWTNTYYSPYAPQYVGDYDRLMHSGDYIQVTMSTRHTCYVSFGGSQRYFKNTTSASTV